MSAKLLLSVALASGIVLASYAPARADFDINAGPISDNQDAAKKCPVACKVTWSGSWTTTDPNKMSVCGASNTLGGTYGNVKVGPIYSQAEADKKCPDGLAKIKWNGQWTTTDPGKMSVCGCTGEA